MGIKETMSSFILNRLRTNQYFSGVFKALNVRAIALASLVGHAIAVAWKHFGLIQDTESDELKSMGPGRPPCDGSLCGDISIAEPPRGAVTERPVDAHFVDRNLSVFHAPKHTTTRQTEPALAHGSVDSIQSDSHWRFRRDILDRLDEYFDCLRRMRLYDADSYDLMSRIGFSVPQSFTMSFEQRLHEGNRPSFGGLLVTARKDMREDAAEGREKSVYPSFIYFQKLKQPGRVQLSHGDTYQLTAMMDDRGSLNRKFVYPLRCHLSIDDSGAIVLLKEAITATSSFIPQSSKKRTRVTFKRIEWKYPSWLMELARYHGQEPDLYAQAILWNAMRCYGQTVDKTIIRAKRGSVTAAFGVELKQCPRFFADRDASILASDGKRKRIFHSVVRHARKVGSNEREVRAHYRGIRKFQWKAYNIGIVLPRIRPDEFMAASVYADDVARKDRLALVSSKYAGERIGALLDS